MKPVLVLFSLVLTLTGCAGAHLKAVAIDEAEFARMWNLYRHCRASADPVLTRLVAQRLGRAAVATEDLHPSLPRPFDQFVTRPPLRLAADPKAMAAACALRAGQVALEAEEGTMAVEMFVWVVLGYPEAEYAYYVDQARARLIQGGNTLHAAVQLLPASFAP